jgi:hypothetical protein
MPEPRPGGEARERKHSERLARLLSEWCGMWEVCHLGPCLRSGRCRGPGVPCFERNIDGFYELLAETEAGKRLFEVAVDAEEAALFE